MSTIDISVKLGNLGVALDSIPDAVVTEIQTMVAGIAHQAKDKAVQLADQRLKTSREDYKRSLKLVSIGDVHVLSLEGDNANAIEGGWNGFDMKEGLLSGPNAEVTAKGTRYNTVPFYHSKTSNKTNQMIQSYLKVAIKQHGLGKIFKDAETGKPLEGAVKQVTSLDLHSYLGGLTKIQKQYEKSTQSYYMTFRRVSDNTDPTKWIHPGYRGAHIFPDVERFIDAKVDEMFSTLF